VNESMTLSDRLRRLLDDRGVSISEAARLAGLEKQQTWRIVTGRNANPGVRTVTRLVEAVGGTMAELFADKETD
jgi:transcriptional regulator with XRE-family HTH domain